MSNTNINLSQDLPNEVQFAIRVICQLTGEDSAKIARLKKDEIYNILGFLMKCEKDKLKKLFRKYDLNKQIDVHILQILRKQIEKSIISATKRGFLSLDEKVDEDIRIRAAQMMRSIIAGLDTMQQEASKAPLNTVAPVTLNATKEAKYMIPLGDLLKVAQHYVESTKIQSIEGPPMGKI